MSENILIIGGNGYVGSKLCHELSGNIVSVDLNIFTTGNNPAKNIKIDYNELDQNFIKQFDHIILLAGHSSVRMCDLHPSSVFNNNVRNFINLLDKVSPNQTLIYASSGSVYGNCKLDSADETTELDSPYNMYDLTKQMIDEYYLTSKHQGRVFGLRLGTINGYSPVLRDDVMMNAMCSTAWRDGHVLLFNPNTKRSIIGTTDLINGIKSIMTSNNTTGGIYNMCSFTKTSGEMAKIVADKIGRPLQIVDPEQYNKEKINEKLVSSKYNFSLSSDKFSRDFSFQFKETPESIVNGLIENKNKMVLTNRNNSYNYNG